MIFRPSISWAGLSGPIVGPSGSYSPQATQGLLTAARGTCQRMLGPRSHAFLAATCRSLLLSARWMPNVSAVEQLCGRRPTGLLDGGPTYFGEDDLYYGPPPDNAMCDVVSPVVDASVPGIDCGPGASFGQCFSEQLLHALQKVLQDFADWQKNHAATYPQLYRNVSAATSSIITAWNGTKKWKLPPGWRPSRGWRPRPPWGEKDSNAIRNLWIQQFGSETIEHSFRCAIDSLVIGCWAPSASAPSSVLCNKGTNTTKATTALGNWSDETKTLVIQPTSLGDFKYGIYSDACGSSRAGCATFDVNLSGFRRVEGGHIVAGYHKRA